jgi:YVTN family beta-propeller protein
MTSKSTPARSLCLLMAATLISSNLVPWSVLEAQSVDRPLRGVEDPGVITTRQSITPAGAQMVFKGRVQGATFGKDGKLWALSRTHLYQVDWLENKVVSQHTLGGFGGIRGLTLDSQSNPIVSLVESRKGEPGQVFVVRPDTKTTPGTLTKIGSVLGTENVGSPFVHAGQVLTPLTYNNGLAMTDMATGQTKTVAVGVAPVAVTAGGDLAYVANWGGLPAQKDALSAPTGLKASADQVRIDARGVALEGSISVVNLTTGTVSANIPVGRHPTALALDGAKGLLYVANTNDDSISIIDVRTRQVRQTIQLQPFSEAVQGVAPSGITLDRAGKRLFIACGGINAVMIYDLEAGRMQGLVPTGWYPVSVTLNQDETKLAIATLLGVGSGQNDGPNKRFVHANRGTIHVVDLPDFAQLASYSAAVAENNRMAYRDGVARSQSQAATSPAPARAIPVRSGEPSLIEHVVYIIKENRTYDQLFGDLERGNGEPSFVMFGEDVTPNQRRLARDFVLLDNFYTTGGNSANGHQWVTQGNEASYTLWPGYSGRSYPFDGSDPLAYSSGGFIWDAVLAKGKSVAVFGEYAPGILNDTPVQRQGLFARWKAGDDFANMWNTTSPIPPLDRALVRNFPAYSMDIPDVVRARIFLDKLKEYEAKGTMPHLTVMLLPSDHTSGTRPGANTPKAMVADNDLALGQVVEGLSKSKFWPKMAIFVVEDDSQNGVDHVDGHRTVALAISPYTRRNHVDSTMYSHQSMLKSIELILGLPSLSLFNLIANDMRASFTDTPNLAPHTAIIPKQELTELNPPLSALTGAPKAAAIASARMNFSVPDAVPTAELNRIVWHNVKGWSTPYPGVKQAAFSPFQLDDGDDD